jgi:hypothetical protein
MIGNVACIRAFGGTTGAGAGESGFGTASPEPRADTGPAFAVSAEGFSGAGARTGTGADGVSLGKDDRRSASSSSCATSAIDLPACHVTRAHEIRCRSFLHSRKKKCFMLVV